MIAIPLSITPPFHPFFFPPSPTLSLYFFPLWRVDIIRSDTSEHAHGLPSVTSRPYTTSVKKALTFSHVPQPGASPLPGYIKTPLDRPKHLRSPVGPPEPITWTLLTPPTLLTKPHFTFPLTNKYIVERITEIYRLEGRCKNWIRKEVAMLSWFSPPMMHCSPNRGHLFWRTRELFKTLHFIR